MSNTNFSTNMGYSRTVSSGSSSGSSSGPSPSAGSWNFDTNIEDYQRTNTETTTSSIVQEDGSLDLGMFIDSGEVGTVGTAEITDSLGIELAELDNRTWYEKALGFVGEVGATIAVGATSILSGAVDVVEGVLDGVVWAGATVASWFGVDTTGAKEFIARDLVSEGNQWFYETTEIGRSINDASYMKYDSETAQGIRSASETATKFAAATALTVCTGGAAAVVLPVAVGFTYGAGEKAENVYNEHGTDTTWQQEAGIAISGVGESFNWFAMGKTGSSALNFFKSMKAIGFKNVGNMAYNGLKEKIAQLSSNTLSQNINSIRTTTVNLLKGTFNKTNLTRTFSKQIRDIDNIMESLGIVGDNVAAWLTGDEELNSETALNALLELGGAWLANMTFSAFGEYLNKAKRINDIPGVNSTQQQNIDDIFNAEHEVANGKYGDSFGTYREHAELHTEAVRDYAVMLGLDLDSIDDKALAEIYYGAYYHDLGMAGQRVDENGIITGLNYDKKTGQYLGLLDDAQVKGGDTISSATGNATRNNHPLNSALSVLSEDIIPEELDRDRIALLALSHSKSTSGISSFADPAQWNMAIDRLEDAVKQYNDINGLTGDDMLVFDAERMRQIISDPTSSEFKQLVDQALCIRDGDAMSDLAFKDGHTIMQTGNVAYVDSPRWSVDSPIPDEATELASITDEIRDANGEQIMRPDKNGQMSAMEVDGIGKKFHAGEENVIFDSTYDGTTYTGRVQMIDAQRVPNSSIYTITERLGELATYTNAERRFIIELPQDLVGTTYGESYKAAIEKSITDCIDDAADKLYKGKITQSQYDNIVDFYTNCIEIPGFGPLKITGGQ